jgi:hypothetical protein
MLALPTPPSLLSIVLKSKMQIMKMFAISNHPPHPSSYLSIMIILNCALKINSIAFDYIIGNICISVSVHIFSIDDDGKFIADSLKAFSRIFFRAAFFC